MIDILEAKEQLYSLQQSLLERATAVVQVGLNMPGGFSLYPAQCLISVAEKSVQAYLSAQNATIVECVSMETAIGPYRLIALRVDGLPLLLKAALVSLEESHPQGRLWDLDVITASGAIDRAALGLPPRTCLLCAYPAHECRRQGRHAPGAVIKAAQKIAGGQEASSSDTC